MPETQVGEYTSYKVGDHVLCYKPFEYGPLSKRTICEAVIREAGCLYWVIDFLNPEFKPNQLIHPNEIIVKVE